MNQILAQVPGFAENFSSTEEKEIKEAIKKLAIQHKGEKVEEKSMDAFGIPKTEAQEIKDTSDFGEGACADFVPREGTGRRHYAALEPAREGGEIRHLIGPMEQSAPCK